MSGTEIDRARGIHAAAVEVGQLSFVESVGCGYRRKIFERAGDVDGTWFGRQRDYASLFAERNRTRIKF